MKLKDALFNEPWRAYRVLQDFFDEDSDDFKEWDLEPLSGPTLAPEDVDGDFQGVFIIAAQLVTIAAAPQPCYLDLVLPERIAEHYFLRVGYTRTRTPSAEWHRDSGHRYRSYRGLHTLSCEGESIGWD